MKLQNICLENPIDFNVSHVWTLVCENPTFFQNLTLHMYNQVEGGSGEWSLWESKQLDISKYVFYLVDFHGVNFADKKATNLLMDHLKNMAFDENHTVDTHRILSEVSAYLTRLASDLDYPVVVDELEMSKLLKSMTFSFLDEAENLYEKMTDFVTLLSRLTVIKILVCINLRSYFSTERLSEFYSHCMQNGIYLLCLESFYREICDNEKVLVLDSDMCEFFVKNTT